MAIVHSFDPPERFVAGTVGEPGARTFFLQARSGVNVVSVAVEKQQVEALSERIDELLDEVMSEQTSNAVIPAVTPERLQDDAPLELPIVEEFRGGTMTLSWDPDDERVVIEVFPVGDDPDPEGEAGEMLLVRLEPGPARAFVQRAAKVVHAGRPDCPFCGRPIDPDGHLCVRANGFKRRDP
ncbi:DUF3090 domain-containing protein [Nocardioides montaniterrae]